MFRIQSLFSKSVKKFDPTSFCSQNIHYRSCFSAMLKAQDETQVYSYQLIASAHHHTVTGMPKECLYHAPKTRNHRAFLYMKAPTLRAVSGSPRRPKKIRPSDRNPMATDERESYYFGVLNKIYLQNFLYEWVANHETNLMSILTS